MIVYKKKSEKGIQETFYTHQSFLDPDKKKKIQDQYQAKSKFQLNLIIGTVLGATWFIQFPKFRNKITRKIPSWLFIGMTSCFVMLLIGIKNSITQPERRNIEEALFSSTMPLWRNPNHVPNLENMFFFLDDDNDNNISLLHHGLSADRAGAVFPDQIVCPAQQTLGVRSRSELVV